MRRVSTSAPSSTGRRPTTLSAGARPVARLLSLLPPTTISKREQLRNLLAHVCFGTQTMHDYFADPLDEVTGNRRWSGWGALDAMHDRGDLTDCDVPLALIVFTTDGISFL